MYGQEAPFVLPKALKRYYEGVIWSSYQYTDGQAVAGTSNARLFSAALGESGQGFPSMSISECNQLESNRIPTGQAFTVYAVAAEPRNSDASQPTRAALASLQYFSVLRWLLLNTTIDIGPLNLIGQAGGISGTTADTGAADGTAGGARVVLNSGFGQCWTYDTLAILLPSSTTFSMGHVWGDNAPVIDGGPTEANLILRISLLGTTMTAVPTG